MMKAIKINKPGEIYVSEIPDAKWKKGYAVIEVKALGVCGSDVHAYAGKSPNVSYPLVIGHETAGIVVEVEDENRYGIKRGTGSFWILISTAEPVIPVPGEEPTAVKSWRFWESRRRAV